MVLAIIEGSGNLSVLKKGPFTSATRKDLGLSDSSVSIGYPVIVEGNVYESVLSEFSIDRQWLTDELRKKGINNFESIFFATIDLNKHLQVTLQQQEVKTPPLYH